MTDELIQLLADHPSRQPEDYPYIFVPPARYEGIQGVKGGGKVRRVADQNCGTLALCTPPAAGCQSGSEPPG